MNHPELQRVCCGVYLDRESAGRRDTETMGGLDVEYGICSVCKQRYEIILDSLDGDRMYPTDMEP